MRKFSKLLTWLDVQRVIRRETWYGSKLPEGIARIGCFSDALEIGISSESESEKAQNALKEWFGDWFEPSSRQIKLDLDDAGLPVEFIFGEEREAETELWIRPFWEEIAYQPQADEESSKNLRLPRPFESKTPSLLAFYSFKGGVGRTLHLAAFVFALAQSAKEMDKPLKILVIDADLEAPGLTYWSRSEHGLATVSFIDFLEAYHYPPTNRSATLKYFAKELKKSAIGLANTDLYFLPACLSDQALMDTPILPEHLARGNPDNPWEFGEAIFQLGKALDADYLFLDLRAGLSEISSPLIFDPRIQRFIFSTLAEQSVRGTALVLDHLRRVSPTDAQVENGTYSDPSLVISLLKPDFKKLPVYEDALVTLRNAYDQSEETLYSKRPPIYESNFNEELMYITDWEDAQTRLQSTSVIRLATEWAQTQLPEPEPDPPSRENGIENVREAVRRLKDICQQYEYAESGEGEDFLITPPLKNLAASYQEKLPQVVSIGAKGSGKTFNYIQLSRLKAWQHFVDRALNEQDTSPRKANIFPLLQSQRLNDNAKDILRGCRETALEEMGIKHQWIPAELRDRIHNALENKGGNLPQWTRFWVQEMARSIGITGITSPSDLNEKLKAQKGRIVFLFDGLEDIFQEIALHEEQQTALRALLDLPQGLSEIRNPNLGLIIFLRRDFLKHAIKQNLGQFESLYQPYELTWDEDSFLKLVFWICCQAKIIEAKESELKILGREEISDKLKKLWGTKLGATRSREAYSVRWVFAALTDFNGRLQARDLVRFLFHAAEITLDSAKEVFFEKWASSRLLPPQAVRKALEPCSKKKVEEAKEEYPAFREWVEGITSDYQGSELRIPFDPKKLPIDSETLSTLTDMGVIYEDTGKSDPERFYMPEIFRTGLGFSLNKGARPRVLILKRKALGSSSL